MDDPGSGYRARARIDRRPWWPIAVLVGGLVLVVHAILFAAVGAPWASEDGPEQAALPTGAAPASTPWVPPPSATPLAGVVLRPSADPAGQQWARLPDVIPVVAERDDPVGDAEYRECEHGECRTIDRPADAVALDITHLGAWIADGALHAEVRLVDSPPTLIDATAFWRVALSVRSGERALDAPVCSGPCGSWFLIPRFTSAVTRGTDEWTVSWQIDLDEITDASGGEGTQPAEALEVLGAASMISGAGLTSDTTAEEPSGAWIAVPGWPSLCPSGSTPDLPGPADQARPPTDLVSMTFDREARQIVLLATVSDATGATETTQTWTFDVCTNRWARRGGAGAPQRALLAYDIDSQAVVAFAAEDWGGPLHAWVFLRTVGGWEQRSAAPLQQLLGVVYEPHSGQIVVHGDTAATAGPELWAYDVERDAWARLREVDPPNLGSDPQHELLAYDPKRERVVLHLIDRSWEYDPASGRWSTEHAASWPVNGGFFGNPASIATDEASGRVVIYSEGHVLAYDGAAGRWASIDTLEPWPDWPEVGALLGQSIVYDPLNRRLVVYGGRAGYPCQDSTVVWAFDLPTGEWALLLAQTAADLRVSGDSAQATPIPGQSPWIGAATVTLHGGPFFTRVPGVADEPWSSSLPAAAASVADGLLLPECQLWTEGTVWWEETTSDPASRAWIEIDLGGTFVLDAALVQADVNDEYRLSYRNLDTAAWTLLWDVPLGDVGGMATRPAQGHPGVHWSLPRPVVTDALRFEAVSGDSQYSVSEIAVFGRPAP